MGDRVDRIDTQAIKRNPALIFPACCKWLIHPKKTLIVATAAKQRRRITLFLNRFLPSMLGKAILMVMGGSFAETIADDAAYCCALQKYRMIYVETQGMAAKLHALGIMNTAIFPNCRKRPERCAVSYKDSKNLKCVFFSNIQENKGVDNILAAAKDLPNVDFAFYGHIDDDYNAHFTNAAAELPNVKYMGVFSGDAESVYDELAKYDVVLLPTKWKTEGVPGILVEAKIAGITCIVSDECYNAEIIKNGEEGIVLSENTPKQLKEAIIKLDSDRELLSQFKSNNRASAEKYYIENYINQIEKSVRGGVTGRRLKAVFFSRISPDKGVDLIFDAAENLSHVDFHLYGEIDNAYSDAFINRISSLPNVTYHGVFRGRNPEVYDELAKYDVMLLPTRWKFEGVPGVLVESKIAGIPAIVSDICYNAEVVEDGVSGIVLKENTAEKLAEAIARLERNRAALYKLKCGAAQSAETYYIENYIDGILDKL